MKHFLMKDPFGSYLARVYYEWMQARDEGREVDAFEEGCRFLHEKFNSSDADEVRRWMEPAEHMGKILDAAPVKADYKYVEPSDYDGIVSESEIEKLDNSVPELSREELLDRLIGGWTGNIAGCMLGKPIEFMKRAAIREMCEATDNYPMRKYEACGDFTPELIKKLGLKTNIPEQPWIDECDGNAAAADDDTNYSVLNLKVLETYGVNFEPNDVLFSWLIWLPNSKTYTAERAAYQNASNGILAPDSARIKNPCREWIGALIRSATIGMVNPGKMRDAADMAFRDACVSHTRNGIYGEIMASVMIAKAMTGANIEEIVRAGMMAVPKRSRLYEALVKAVADYRAGMTYDEALDKLHSEYDENNLFDWCHTIPNAVILVLSLLYSEGDFSAAIGNSVTAGFDTDSTTAIVGCIAGCRLGKEKMPSYWGDTFNNRLYSDVAGYEDLSTEELALKTLSLIKGETEINDRIKVKYDYKEQFTS